MKSPAALMLVVLMVGCSGGGPTAPSLPIPTLPAALLVPVDDATGELQADGSYALSLHGVNRGDGCASVVAGVTSFQPTHDGEAALTRTWTLPTPLIVSPGARFDYHVCCLTYAEAIANAFYTTAFTFTTVACP